MQIANQPPQLKSKEGKPVWCSGVSSRLGRKRQGFSYLLAHEAPWTTLSQAPSLSLTYHTGLGCD